MGKTTARTWVFAPVVALALAFAFACASAPAAFAGPVEEQLQLRGVAIQDDAAATDGTATDSTATDGTTEEPYTYGVGADIERAKVTFTNGKTFNYTGKEIEPAFTVTLDGQTLRGTTDPDDETADYFYFYMNNVENSRGVSDNVDKPQLVLATFGDEEPYVWIKQAYFNIRPVPIKSAKARVANQVYTGNLLKPGADVTYKGMTLKAKTDYTIVGYRNNRKVGTAKVILQGKGNYQGKVAATFKITKASIRNAKFKGVKTKVYTGSAITQPTLKVTYKGKTLKKGKDYTLVYHSNKNAGVAAVTVRGKGNLKGAHRIEFVIEPRPITKCKASISGDTLWNGSFITPSTILKYNGKTLVRGRDYTVYYSNNSEVGTANAYINASGNFSGSRTLHFTIKPRPIDNWYVNASLPYPSYQYTYGAVLEPRPTLVYNGRTLVWGVDYQLSWNNTNFNTQTGRGTGYVTITGIGSHFTSQRVLSYGLVDPSKTNSNSTTTQ